MQSFEDIKLPLLGDAKQSGQKAASDQETKNKAKVRFLVDSELQTVVMPASLATTVQQKIETLSNITNNRPDVLSHAKLRQGETRFERQAKPRRTATHDVVTNQISVRQVQELIQDKNESLRLLVKEQDELRNDVAMADHAIMELKTRLAEVNSSLSNAKNHEQGLQLEMEKLKHEKGTLKKRCANAVWERASRLRAKDEKIANVQAETTKTLKLCDEVAKRNQDLRERLEKRENIAFGLKTKFALLSNWTVR